MKGILKAACLLVLVCGMQTGCNKNGVGTRDIRFTASSYAVATRTSYSGAGETGTSGSLVKERINWVAGDLITVWSDNAVNETTGNNWGDFKVVSATADGTRSRATIEPVDINSLQWGDASSYKFYARYPADGAKIDGTAMTATIPASQQMKQVSGEWVPDMQYAYMFASATATDTSAPVELDFYPEFTAFQFEIGAGGNGEAKIASFVLSSTTTPLAGDFSVACATGVASVTGTGSTTLAMDVTNRSSESKLILTGGADPVTLTLFALPTDIEDLTLTVTGTPFGTRTLKLANKNGSMISFDGGKKYLIKGLDLPELLEASGEDILWDVVARGESIYWD